MTPAQPLAAFADDELLEMISWKDQDLSSAHQAFDEFYRRFKDRTAAAIIHLCRNYTNNQKLAMDVLNNTFFNVYLYAGSFKTDGETDAVVIRKKIYGWLIRISKTELLAMNSDKRKKTDLRQLYPKESDQQADLDIYADAGLAEPRASPTRDTYETEMVRKAINQIPKERDRQIFDMYWLTYTPNPGGKAKKMPDGTTAMLAKKYNTTPQNVRKIISRTFAQVKEFLEENLKNKR